jgi:hypothetical protein
MSDPDFAAESARARPLRSAQTYAAVSDLLAEKPYSLDPACTPPSLQLLRQRVRVHRVKAMLPEGQAAAIGYGTTPGVGQGGTGRA